jgi:hypothetical protein
MAETLPGIETPIFIRPATSAASTVPQWLKPFQGLKPIRIDTKLDILSVPQWLKPFQGLKLIGSHRVQ